MQPINDSRKFDAIWGIGISSFTPHYPTQDDDDSTNSNLNHFQQGGNAYKRVDSYDFVHDTDLYTPMDIPQEFDDGYYSYLDKHYSVFDDGYSITHMQKLTDKDISNHIKEINNNVTRVNFDANYSYQHKQMAVNNFQGIIDTDTSCTFPLPRYFLMDWYTGWFGNCTDSQEQIDSIVITADPYIDLFTLCDMIGDCLASFLTAKGLWFWQQWCELQFAHEEAAENKIDTTKFTTLHEINNEINWLHLEHLYTAKKNVIISLYDLKSKILPKDALNIYPDDFHTWIDNTGAIELSVWINRSKPMIYESMKKAQSDETHPLWSTHKQTIHIAWKPRADIYKEFLSRKTIHIHAENTPLVDKLTRYSPTPLPGLLLCATFLIIFVVILLILLPGSLPLVFSLIGLVTFLPSPRYFL